MRFGEDEILRDVSGSVKAGQMLGVLGPSGKTRVTICCIKLILGFTRESTGSGMDFSFMPSKFHRRCGVMCGNTDNF